MKCVLRARDLSTEITLSLFQDGTEYKYDEL